MSKRKQNIKKSSGCGACGGKGWLRCNIGNDEYPRFQIQRCDTCEKYTDDDEARRVAVANEEAGGTIVYLPMRSRTQWVNEWHLEKSLEPNEGHQIMSGSRCLAVTTTSDNNYASEESEKASARMLVNANKMFKLCCCALADLQGLLPECEPSGERTHPGWITARDLENVIASIKGEL